MSAATTNITWTTPSGSTGSGTLTDGGSLNIPIGSQLVCKLANPTGLLTWSMTFQSDNASINQTSIQAYASAPIQYTLPLALSTVTLEIVTASDVTGNTTIRGTIVETLQGQVSYAGGLWTVSSLPTLGQTTTTVSNGLNSNVLTQGQQSVMLTGPTGPFSVGGFQPTSAPAGGTILLVSNLTTQAMTIVHEDVSSTAAYRIDTMSGLSVTIPPGSKSQAMFVYNGTTSRWMLQNLGISRPTTFHAKDFGAAGDGSTDDSAAIIAAANAAAAASAVSSVVHFDTGTYRFTSNQTLPAGVTYRFQAGAMLAPDSGKTITISGAVDSVGDVQCFGGAGSIVFTAGATRHVYADWFGTNSYASVSRSPLQLAVNAVGGTGIPIKLLANTYNIGASSNSATGLLISQPCTFIDGESGSVTNPPTLSTFPRASLINYLGTGTAIDMGVSPGSGNTLLTTLRLSHFSLYAPNATVGIRAWLVTVSQFLRLAISGPWNPSGAAISTSSPTCLKIQGAINVQVKDCFIYGYGGITPAYASRTVTDGVMSNGSTTLQSSTASFQAHDAGVPITVLGAGPGGAELATTIASVTDSSHVVLSASASTSVAGVTCNIGNRFYTVYDGVIASGTNTLACTTSHLFADALGATDVGSPITVVGAGASGGNLVTTITSVTNSGHVVLAANASTSVTANFSNRVAVPVVVGSDQRAHGAIGIWIGSASGVPSTTVDVFSTYISTCALGTWVETSYANFYGCVFEQCLRGAQTQYSSHGLFDQCWFEGNGNAGAIDANSIYGTAPFEAMGYAYANTQFCARGCQVTYYDRTYYMWGTEPGGQFIIDGCRFEPATAIQPFAYYTSGKSEAATHNAMAYVRAHVVTTPPFYTSPAFSTSGEDPSWKFVRFTDLRLRTYTFVNNSVGAGLSNAYMNRADGGGTNYGMPEAGYILGFNVVYYGTIPGGEHYSVNVGPNGVAELQSGNITNNNVTPIDVGYLSQAFNYSDNLTARLTTSAGFTGSGNMVVEIIVAFGNLAY